MYTIQDVLEYIEVEDVKFLRLAFCDIFGSEHNVAIMSSEAERIFKFGKSIDASAIPGFGSIVESDLFLFPDPKTLTVLPWRPSTGRVAKMYCDIRYPDGTPFDKDGRYILRKAVEKSAAEGIFCTFGTEFEFYLFKTNENGEATDIPFDTAHYMSIAPEDKGENVRREICLTLEDMGIKPESSHHEEGPGQNEIDFMCSDALGAADNATTFKSVVKTIAMRNGLAASFSPKPLPKNCGSGMHINMSVSSKDGEDKSMFFMAGILKYIREITAFLNPVKESYFRLGEMKAPHYVTWSPENRSQLIRIPAPDGSGKRIELRSPDPQANPYFAFALLIHAGLEGIKNRLSPGAPTNINLLDASPELIADLEVLPQSFTEAAKLTRASSFVQNILPKEIIDCYCRM